MERAAPEVLCMHCWPIYEAVQNDFCFKELLLILRCMWVRFVIGSLPCSQVFSPGSP